MARPGVEIQVQTLPPPRSAPTDSGVAFMVGLCDKGAQTPILVESLDEFVQLCGARVTYGLLYDAVDVFFKEGGDSAYISRVVGPAAAQASKNLLDGVAAISLIVKADSVGAWGNSLKVAVVAGDVSGYKIQISDALNNILESSTDLTTQQDAVTWSLQSSNYVTITIGASALVPVVAGLAALTGGADDRASITDAHWLTALSLFGKDLGPGQVLAPGRTTDVGHQQLADHAAARNRVALLDLTDTATTGTLQTSANNAKTTGNGEYAAAFSPWVVVPGVVAGTTRTVPPSAAVAGVIARVDASDNPNVPAAGKRGVLRYAIGISQPAWADTVRETLNNNGVNVILNNNQGIRIYGYRSLADPINNQPWLDFSTVRYLMWLASRCESAGEGFTFDPLDGKGHTISDYGAALSALCQEDWDDDIIYGQTASEAFNVDTGSSVNTAATIAANELRATVAVRPAPFAELVSILIVNVPITEAVA